MSCPKVNVVAIIFQNSFGERYYSKYFPILGKSSQTQLSTIQEQKLFQKNLLVKVGKMNVINRLKPQQNEIFAFGDFTILLKVINQLLIFVVCDEQENYFVIEEVINCIGTVLTQSSKEQYVGKTIYDNLSTIVLIVDQLIDQGIIVHLDPNTILDRIKMNGQPGSQKKIQNNKTSQPIAAAANNNISTWSSLFGYAKSSLQKTLNLN